MIFHTFGDPAKKAVILIHGMLTPWQMWEYQIEKLMDRFYVIVPALDAHTEEEKSEFISVEDEADKIEKYILDNLEGKVHAVCGISMGGVIAGIIWKNEIIKTDCVIMDGSPFSKMPKIAVNIMLSNYLKIVHLSQKRDSSVKEGFCKNLLPEKYYENYLHMADKMSDESIKNILTSVFAGHYPEGADSSVKAVYLHGTKGTESTTVKIAKRFKNDYPDMTVICRKGHAHVENACFHPEKWYEEICEFI